MWRPVNFNRVSRPSSLVLGLLAIAGGLCPDTNQYQHLAVLDAALTRRRNAQDGQRMSHRRAFRLRIERNKLRSPIIPVMASTSVLGSGPAVQPAA